MGGSNNEQNLISTPERPQRSSERRRIFGVQRRIALSLDGQINQDFTTPTLGNMSSAFHDWLLRITIRTDVKSAVAEFLNPARLKIKRSQTLLKGNSHKELPNGSTGNLEGSSEGVKVSWFWETKKVSWTETENEKKCCIRWKKAVLCSWDKLRTPGTEPIESDLSTEKQR